MLEPPQILLDKAALLEGLEQAARMFNERGLDAREWLDRAVQELGQHTVIDRPGEGARLLGPNQAAWPESIGLERISGWAAQSLERPLCENQSVPGIVVIGGCPPDVFSLVWHATPAIDTGYQPPIYVCETKGEHLLIGLAILAARGEDIQQIVRSPRYRPIVGDDQARALESVLGEHSAAKLPGSVVPASEDPLHLKDAEVINELLVRFGAIQRTRLTKFKSKEPTPEEWERRKERLASGERLKIVIPTTRYATVVRHFAGDVASAVESLGHECLLIEEPGPHELMTTLSMAEAIKSFDPDLVFCVNYSRGLIAAPVPATVPVITWIQDNLVQFESISADQIGDCDIALGHMYPAIQKAFAYDSGRMLACDVAAAEKKFLGGVRRDEYLCEVAMMTRHSESPQAMVDRLCNSFARVNGMDKFIHAFASDISELTGTVGQPGLKYRVVEFTKSLIRERLGAEPEPAVTNQIVTMISEPMVDLVVRHETVRWAVNICERRDWRFHLYGRGWGDHPEFGKYARGEVEHGSELRDAYASATVVLHSSSRSMAHQRIAEAALAGSLPFARRIIALHWRDEQLIFSKLANNAEGKPWEHNPIAECYNIDDVPEAAAIYDRLLREGYTPNPLRFIPDRRVRIRCDFADSLRHKDEQSAIDRYAIFGDLESSTFVDEATLESMTLRAVDDPEWRAAKIEEMAAVASNSLTLSVWMKKAINAVRTIAARQ